jgi:hypothetical protein
VHYWEALQVLVDEFKTLDESDGLRKLPVIDVIASARQAVAALVDYQDIIQSWEVPLSIAEKELEMNGFFSELVRTCHDAIEYMEHVGQHLSTAKKAFQDKKKQWRNARTSVATALQARAIPAAVAKVVGWVQHHSSAPCEASGMDSILSTHSLEHVPSKTDDDAPKPFAEPCHITGEMRDQLHAYIEADMPAITEKYEELRAACDKKHGAFGYITAEATGKFDWTFGLSDDVNSTRALNVGENKYKRHIVFLMENGRMELTPAACPFTTLPHCLSIIKGSATVIVLSPADCESLGKDIPSAIRDLSENPIENGKLGKVFHVETMGCVWIPFGFFAVIVGLCCKHEENKFRKTVLSWPTKEKRTMDDFTVGIIEPMLDIKAVESGGDSLKGKVAAQVLLNQVSIPKSFSECLAFAEFKKTLGISAS